MSTLIYNDVDLIINEKKRSILVNPKGERFYFTECDELYRIYRNATLTLDENGCYVIEGTQTLYTEHNAMGLSREKLLCSHPQELIRKRSFLGVIWYSVSGIMKRDVQSRYCCVHKNYAIHERLEFLSHECTEV